MRPLHKIKKDGDIQKQGGLTLYPHMLMINNVKTTFIRFLTASLCLWLTGLYAYAQEPTKLVGRVIDDEQLPLPMVTVRIEGLAAATTTNLDGKYELDFTASDSAVVVYSMIGYQTRRRVLRKPQGRLTLNITMRPMTIEVNEVTVKEVQRQMGSKQKMNVEHTRNLPSTTGNAVEELVATQAGVSTHNELSSQYNVRGGSFDENSVYINGVEVYRPLLISSGQQEGLSVINSDMVEGIEFSAGGFEAQYGDKMSSVLDITYRRPKRFEATASGSLLGGSAYVGFSRKHFSLSQGVRYKTNQYLLGSLETKGEYSPRFLDYQAYLSWTPNKRWTLDVIGNISQNKYDFIPENRETNFGTMEDVKSFRVYFDGQERDLFRTLFGTANLTRHFGTRTSLSLLASAFSTKERQTYDIQGQYWLSETNTSEQLGVGTYMEHARNILDADVKSLKLSFSHRPSTAHHIMAGVMWKSEHIRERAREWEMRDSSGYSLPHLSDRLQLIYNLKSNNRIGSNRMELYAQDTWRFAREAGIFSLNYGARMSYWDWNREWLFSPRVSLGYIPAFNENFTFRLATGLYYQAPFYKELRDTTTVAGTTTVQLNPDIKSQRSFQVVLAGDYKFRMMDRPFKFSAELYYKALSNVNPYIVDNVKISYYGENIARGYTMGLDLKLFGEFVPGTDSWVSLSLMNARQRINGANLPQPTDQRYNINFFFSDFFPNTTRWKMTLKACFADGLPFGPPHTGLEKQVYRAPAYKRVDIGMNYRLLNNEDHSHKGKVSKLLRNVWLGVDCFNVFGLSNVSSYYWITDVTNEQYAVPNYLTGRQLNVRFLIEI